MYSSWKPSSFILDRASSKEMFYVVPLLLVFNFFNFLFLMRFLGNFKVFKKWCCAPFTQPPPMSVSPKTTVYYQNQKAGIGTTHRADQISPVIYTLMCMCYACMSTQPHAILSRVCMIKIYHMLHTQAKYLIPLC